MARQVEFDPRAEKELASLDKQSQREIIRYLRERIATEDDPRRFGKALRGGLQGLWRYPSARPFTLPADKNNDRDSDPAILPVGRRGPGLRQGQPETSA